MHKKLHSVLVGAVAASAAIAATGCDDFLTVDNPTVIDAGTIDPVVDAPTFALSALNNLYDAFDNVVVYQAWFTGEAWVGDTFPTRNDIAKRQTEFNNGTLDGDIWSPLSLAIASGERVQELLADVDASTNINIARATFASAYAVELMAETFCQVVISSGLDNLGAPLTPAAGSAQAAQRFQKVINIATANGSAAALDLANAARVGLARAELQQGNYAAAIAAAAQVPAGFEYFAPRVDDPANRGALGNTVYSFTLARPSLVVPPYYRALNDPRVPFELELDKGKPAKTQGNDLDFYKQTKYTEWGADVRLASGLEARYISAEAKLKQGDPSAAVALIAERQRAGTAEGNDFASGNPTLVELLDQKSRDFYLEAKHMGDWLRNRAETPYVLPAGSPYYVPELGIIGTQTCLPVPDDEVNNNPNFPKQ